MEYWSAITNETLENARIYKKQAQDRQHQCIDETLIDSEAQKQYEQCSDNLQQNWQIFLLKLEWERHKLQDCLLVAKKANIKSEEEIKKMCCSTIKNNIETYFDQLQRADFDIIKKL